MGEEGGRVEGRRKRVEEKTDRPDNRDHERGNNMSKGERRKEKRENR